MQEDLSFEEQLALVQAVLGRTWDVLTGDPACYNDGVLRQLNKVQLLVIRAADEDSSELAHEALREARVLYEGLSA